MPNDDVRRDFYVYLHVAPDGTPFYVGKGTGDRAHDKASRNRHWKKKVESYGGSYVVEIYKDNITEDEANDLEIQLIGEYGKLCDGDGTLVNITDGGADRAMGVTLSINLPGLEEEYNNASYKTPAKGERDALANLIIERVLPLRASFKACTQNREDETDLESTVEEALDQAHKESKRLVARKVSFKDYCFNLEGFREDIGFDLEDMDPSTENQEVVTIAKKLQSLIETQIVPLRISPD